MAGMDAVGILTPGVVDVALRFGDGTQIWLMVGLDGLESLKQPG